MDLLPPSGSAVDGDAGSAIDGDHLSRPVPPTPQQWNILNFYASPAKMDPWVPLGALQPHQSVAAAAAAPIFPSYPHTFLDYRSVGTPSDCATLPGDSGYGSIHQSFSIASASVHGGDEIGQAMGDCRINLEPPFPSLESPTKPALCHVCEECKATLKSQGELKKHRQRHLKSHKCPYPNCPKGRRGFSTSNDLVRHKRSVHGEHDLPGKSFVCPFCTPGSKGPKVWPRADNFRSHLQRSHHFELKSDDDHKQYLYRPRNDLEEVGDSQRSSASQVPGGAGKSPPQHDGRLDAIPDIDYGSDQQQYFFSAAAGGENTALIRGQHAAPNAHRPMLDMGLEQFLAEPELAQPSPWPSSSGSEAHVSSMPEPVVNAARQGSDWTPDGEGIGLGEFATRPQLAGDAAASTPLPSSDPSDIVKYLMTFPKPCLQTALRASLGPSDDDSGWKCAEKECGKTFNRPCELKKHMKRHEKPYGCTFMNCSKRFGSKNDWKRHESSQHLVLEKWDCDEPGCGRICHRRESFKNHLQKDHGMRSGSIMDEKLETCRLGRHCDPRFWCGFCVQVIDVEEDVGGNSWTKRCDHIDNHLFGKEGLAKKTMAEWKYQEEEARPDEGERKRDRRRRRNRAVKTQTYMWTCDGGGEQCGCWTTMNLKTSSCCFECHHVRCESDCLVEHVEAAESDQDYDVDDGA
ncbi:hypothetical protein CP533_4884 [Ophiocordyceps camponoti-saundersi (nom. inval.)]|nr:hypothetical protein CP533_4884 [Ophiocordyceps camponoti-saundersi (nom. inval.)]